MRKSIAIALSILLAAAPIASLRADALGDIKASGNLRLGVKSDYPPFGHKNGAELVGLEIDLAKDLASRLGVNPTFLPVVAVNRLSMLEDGKVDVIVATLTDTEERRRRVRMIEPHYYASGTNAITAKRRRFKSWAALTRKPVCGIHGAFYNRDLVERVGIRLVGFVDTASALGALKGGRCAAFAFDDAFLQGVLMLPDWRNYEMPFETTNVAPWGVAVAGGKPALGVFIATAVEDWHRSGLILELEKRHGLRPSTFAARMHEKYR